MFFGIYVFLIHSLALSGSFLTYNNELEGQRELLVAVQMLLNIPPSLFPELDHTQEVMP